MILIWLHNQQETEVNMLLPLLKTLDTLGHWNWTLLPFLEGRYKSIPSPYTGVFYSILNYKY